MVTVEFRSVGSGTCGWCRKEKDEVFTVAFPDKSFAGAMCRGDLMRAIGMKLTAGETVMSVKPEAKPAAPAYDPKTATHTNGGGYGPPGGTATDSVASKK